MSGVWVCPKSKVVLRAARLYKVAEYVGVQRRGIAGKIATRPVLELVKAAERRRGQPPRTYWHELPMDVRLDPKAFRNRWGPRHSEQEGTGRTPRPNAPGEWGREVSREERIRMLHG